MNLGVLVSGNLGFNVLKHLFQKYRVKVVLTDKNSTDIIEFCKMNGIEFFAGNPRNKEASQFYLPQKIEVLISVNYLFLIDKGLIQLPSIIAFNIHGSLLPKYRGRTPHVWAIINNESKTGITAHLIDEGCDTGDIIEQIIVEIDDKDTGNDLLNKYNALYIPLIENVLEKIKCDMLTFSSQNDEFATYFGKRTPEDGQINWNWHKERIRNWIRAQAFPYPGAFTFYENEKVIVDEIEFVEFGFSQDTVNGKIISNSPLMIKTPNGVVLLKRIRTEVISFEKFKVLN